MKTLDLSGDDASIEEQLYKIAKVYEYLISFCIRSSQKEILVVRKTESVPAL